jgi:hypothetical protein
MQHSCNTAEKSKVPEDVDTTSILPVLVRNLAGTELELNTHLTTSVHELKLLVEEKWNFPTVCQCLLLEATELQDGGKKLGDYCSAELQEGPLPTLELTFVYRAPYDGDVHKASLAGDRDAIRALMRFRDQDKNQKVPPSLAIIVRPSLKRQPGWAGARSALIERGYDEDAVDECISDWMSSVGNERYSYDPVRARELLGREVLGEVGKHRYSYDQVLGRLEEKFGKLPEDQGFLKWWQTPPN